MSKTPAPQSSTTHIKSFAPAHHHHHTSGIHKLPLAFGDMDTDNRNTQTLTLCDQLPATLLLRGTVRIAKHSVACICPAQKHDQTLSDTTLHTPHMPCHRAALQQPHSHATGCWSRAARDSCRYCCLQGSQYCGASSIIAPLLALLLLCAAAAAAASAGG